MPESIRFGYSHFSPLDFRVVYIVFGIVIQKAMAHVRKKAVHEFGRKTAHEFGLHVSVACIAATTKCLKALVQGPHKTGQTEEIWALNFMRSLLFKVATL